MKKMKLLSAILSLLVMVGCTERNVVTDSETSLTTSSETEIAETTEENNSSSEEYKYVRYAEMSPEEIVAEMTLEQKAAQMVQPAIYRILGENDMQKYDYGSILSKIPGFDEKDWQEVTNDFQLQAVLSDSGIPMLYGNDDVHGVNFCSNAVLFPHNIGLGAANDEELMYQVGLITADEAKICHMPWNFAPVVTQSVDPRWGRTYECYSSDLEMIKKLSTAYTKGLIDGGIVACSKHFFGEGFAEFGTGEDSYDGDIFNDRLIDRGNATVSDEEISELLKVYQAQIDAGVQTIMVSHASLNGTKMHENKKYIMMLKEEMGFEGFIVSDWNSAQNIPNKNYDEQIITAVNSGIDMLMEPDKYNDAMDIIINAVKNGDITEERINEAVRRIIKVKKDSGIFDDPFFENTETKQKSTGSQEYRDIAEKLVEESLVLLKNDNSVLPIKNGTSVYIMGPASDNDQVQCGGWTIDWNSSPDTEIEGVTSLLEGFQKRADEFGINIITNKKDADKADIILLAVGEQSYAEWNGDTEDLELCGELGLSGNRNAIEEAQSYGKPVVTCIIAGRNVIIDEEDFNNWDSVVMCYLPGSEGQGIADVLCGKENFTGKLPSPWYNSTEQIPNGECWLDFGYGLTY